MGRMKHLKMLQIPAANAGRYAVAGQYMAIARELGIHINNLTRTLNELNPQPHPYWFVKANYNEKKYGDLWQKA